MAISGDYAHPVNVNGFPCRNCTEVAEATKHIDPAHPKDGPYGINAPDPAASLRGPAVTLSPRLAALSSVEPSRPQPAPTPLVRLDVSV